jgi:hypothetical protein
MIMKKFMISFSVVMLVSMSVFAGILFGLINQVNDIAVIVIASAASVISIITVDKAIKSWV